MKLIVCSSERSSSLAGKMANNQSRSFIGFIENGISIWEVQSRTRSERPHLIRVLISGKPKAAPPILEFNVRLQTGESSDNSGELRISPRGTLWHAHLLIDVCVMFL
mmetsp:Transcript_32361/g.64954  ORF Transcript_32361/g.64954 Transcript_32361/m.64954 type:complete len:107 (+) Transcript_32361:322-642(+)